ncbi:unnamed protein product [Pedinophyceae sp. YPF-701]|nr:unnamed protein product [Pedinophyceae sp. YPF-701]
MSSLEEFDAAWNREFGAGSAASQSITKSDFDALRRSHADTAEQVTQLTAMVRAIYGMTRSFSTARAAQPAAPASAPADTQQASNAPEAIQEVLAILRDIKPVLLHPKGVRALNARRGKSADAAMSAPGVGRLGRLLLLVHACPSKADYLPALVLHGHKLNIFEDTDFKLKAGHDIKHADGLAVPTKLAGALETGDLETAESLLRQRSTAVSQLVNTARGQVTGAIRVGIKAHMAKRSTTVVQGPDGPLHPYAGQFFLSDASGNLSFPTKVIDEKVVSLRWCPADEQPPIFDANDALDIGDGSLLRAVMDLLLPWKSDDLPDALFKSKITPGFLALVAYEWNVAIMDLPPKYATKSAWRQGAYSRSYKEYVAIYADVVMPLVVRGDPALFTTSEVMSFPGMDGINVQPRALWAELAQVAATVGVPDGPPSPPSGSRGSAGGGTAVRDAGAASAGAPGAATATTTPVHTGSGNTTVAGDSGAGASAGGGSAGGSAAGDSQRPRFVEGRAGGEIEGGQRMRRKRGIDDCHGVICTEMRRSQRRKEKAGDAGQVCAGCHARFHPECMSTLRDMLHTAYAAQDWRVRPQRGLRKIRTRVWRRQAAQAAEPVFDLRCPISEVWERVPLRRARLAAACLVYAPASTPCADVLLISLCLLCPLLRARTPDAPSPARWTQVRN